MSIRDFRVAIAEVVLEDGHTVARIGEILSLDTDSDWTESKVSAGIIQKMAPAIVSANPLPSAQDVLAPGSVTPAIVPPGPFRKFYRGQEIITEAPRGPGVTHVRLGNGVEMDLPDIDYKREVKTSKLT